MRKPTIALALLGCAAFLAGCASNGSGISVPPSQPVAPGAVSAATATITISPATLSFQASAVKKIFTITERGYSGTYTVTPNAKTCKNVVTVTAEPKNKKAFTVVSGTKAGTCSINVADKNGNSATVKAIVTLTTGIIN